MARTDTEKSHPWRDEGIAFKRLYEAVGLKQSVLSREMKVSPDVVSQYATGRTRIPFSAHETLARLFNTTVAEVRRQIVLLNVPATYDDMEVQREAKPLAHERPNVRIVNVETIELVEVPVYGAISAHRTEYNLSDVVEFVKLPKSPTGRAQWGRVVSGTCMEDIDNPGEGFEDGDIALFEDAPFEDGMGVHAFRLGEETFKIYRDFGERKELWPTNVRDGSERIEIDNSDWEVRGVCMGRIRRGKGYEDLRRYPHGYRFRFRQALASALSEATSVQ